MKDCKPLNPSLVTRDASSAIKGLLMLLIVFGHTGMLTTDFATGERTFFWHWLYSFHVYVFLILPFIYGYERSGDAKQRLKSDIKHNLIKIGVPYCWFFALSALVFATVGGGSFNPKGMVYAFLFGSQSLMSKYIGFNFIWFMPALLALTILKSLWYNSSRMVRGCMLTISVVLWLLAIFNVLPLNTVGMYVPFSLSQAFYYLPLGLAARWLVERTCTKKTLPWVALLAIAITIMMYYQRKTHWTDVISYTTLYWLMMPVTMFVLLHGLGDLLSKSKLLKTIGNYSFQVYLVHVYVINILLVILLRFWSQSIALGIVIYVLTWAISMGLAFIMVKVRFVNKVIFPKG